MIEISPDEVPFSFRHLFRSSGHTFRRCFAVLDGKSGGTILTDYPESPTWVAVHELSSDGSLFLAGLLNRDTVASILERLRRERTVTIAWREDNRWDALLPGNASRKGVDVEFEDRSGVNLEALIDPPDGLMLARIDHEIEPHCIWTPWMFVDGEKAVERGIGYCLLDDDRVVSEAYAGPEVDGVLEMAVITEPAYQRRGLGRIVSARTVLECEQLGYQTWWNTSLENVGSAAIARSLGYRTERHYRTLAWDRPSGGEMR